MGAYDWFFATSLGIFIGQSLFLSLGILLGFVMGEGAMGFSIPHLLVVLVVLVVLVIALLVFGSKRLKNIGEDLGAPLQAFVRHCGMEIDRNRLATKNPKIPNNN